MEYDPVDKTSQKYIQIMQVQQSLTIEQLKNLRGQIYHDYSTIDNQRADLIQNYVQRQDQIYQHQLDHILMLLDKSQQLYFYDEQDDEQDSFLDNPYAGQLIIPQFSKKLMKFLTQGYDYMPQIQQKALKIYSKVYPSGKIQNIQQINLILRLISIQSFYDEYGLKIFQKIIQNLDVQEQQYNIIDLILKGKSIKLLQRLINYDQAHAFSNDIVQLISNHIYSFRRHLKSLNIYNLEIESEIEQEVVNNFIQLIDICLIHITNQYNDIETKYQFTKCLGIIFNDIHIFRAELKYIYHHQNMQENKYQQLANNLMKKVYDSGIFKPLIDLGYRNMDQKPRMFNYIFACFHMIVDFISQQQFLNQLIPLIQTFFKTTFNDDLFNQYSNIYYQASMILIKFINIKADTQNKDFFRNIFVKSQLFDLLNKNINKIMKIICYKRYYMDKSVKKRGYGGDRVDDLFVLVVLVFELNEKCRIYWRDNNYWDYRYTLQASIKMIKQLKKKSWQEKLVGEYWQQMIQHNNPNWYNQDNQYQIQYQV